MAKAGSQIKPLFGDRALSYFGDRKQLCRGIIEKLNLAPASSSEHDDPEIVLRNFTKEAVLRTAFEMQLGLDDLVPLPTELNPEEVDQLSRQAVLDGVQAFSVEGELPPQAAIARVLLQFKVLDELCGAVQEPEWSDQKREFMRTMRVKLDKVLQNR